MKILLLALLSISCAGRGYDYCSRPPSTAIATAQCINVVGTNCPSCDNTDALYSANIVADGSNATIKSATSCQTITNINYGNGDYETDTSDWSEDGLTESNTLTITTLRGTCIEYQIVTFKE